MRSHMGGIGIGEWHMAGTSSAPHLDDHTSSGSRSHGHTRHRTAFAVDEDDDQNETEAAKLALNILSKHMKMSRITASKVADLVALRVKAPALQRWPLGSRVTVVTSWSPGPGLSLELKDCLSLAFGTMAVVADSNVVRGWVLLSTLTAIGYYPAHCLAFPRRPPPRN